MSNIDISVTDS